MSETENYLVERFQNMDLVVSLEAHKIPPYGPHPFHGGTALAVLHIAADSLADGNPVLREKLVPTLTEKALALKIQAHGKCEAPTIEEYCGLQPGSFAKLIEEQEKVDSHRKPV